MRLARALELTPNIASTPSSIEELGASLDPSLVELALERAAVATLRKRRLSLEMMLWCVTCMSFTACAWAFLGCYQQRLRRSLREHT